MFKSKPEKCPITGDKESKLVHSYNKPPSGETEFKFLNPGSYNRELWQFQPSKHFVSIFRMDLDTNYQNAYMEATYKSIDNLQKTFKKIISLPQEKSDNYSRLNFIKEFSKKWFLKNKLTDLLDIGSGLGIFPYSVRKIGWNCTALDPDQNAINHMIEIGLDTFCGDFRYLRPNKKYDIITLNKVLEHLEDPIEFLKLTKLCLSESGFIYLELPDGEAALHDSPEREEFFLEHIHIFSISSTISLITKAGFVVHNIQRIIEPSGKYTIRAIIFREKYFKNYIAK